MKILYVDDISPGATALQRLAQYLGHEFITAVNGQDGYALALKQPDLIFIDINLPDTNGLTLVQQLRAENIRVPVIAMTADVVNYGKESALKAGCSDFLGKPFSLDTFKSLLIQYNDQK